MTSCNPGIKIFIFIPLMSSLLILLKGASHFDWHFPTELEVLCWVHPPDVSTFLCLSSPLHCSGLKKNRQTSEQCKTSTVCFTTTRVHSLLPPLSLLWRNLNRIMFRGVSEEITCERLTSHPESTVQLNNICSSITHSQVLVS